MNNKIFKVAEILDMASFNATPVIQLKEKFHIRLDEAYKIQEESIKRRFIRGEKHVGFKMGFTSHAKMKQMGVNDLIWGRLTDQMSIENRGDLKIENFIHPRVEPEIAFRIGKKIDRPLSIDELKTYVDGLCPAIEVIDSRYENFKFSLEDVVSDNCSSAAFVLGDWLSNDTDISNLEIKMLVDDQIVEEGHSSAILDNPWESVVEASRLISQFGDALDVGDILLAGAATPAAYVKKGQRIKVNIENMSTITLNIV